MQKCHCHSLSSLKVTIVSCSLQLPPLDLWLSLSLLLPLPLSPLSLPTDKKNACNNKIHTRCTNTSSYKEFEVNAVTANLQQRQA